MSLHDTLTPTLIWIEVISHIVHQREPDLREKRNCHLLVVSALTCHNDCLIMKSSRPLKGRLARLLSNNVYIDAVMQFRTSPTSLLSLYLLFDTISEV